MNISSYYLFLTITFFTRIMGLKIIAVAIGIGILLTITAFGNGFNSAYAKHDRIRVDCKDLAIALITWDQLLGTFRAANGEKADFPSAPTCS
jgi:hypothetical protein